MSSVAEEGVARWFAYMDSGHDPAGLHAMLAPDAVFHSPVVHTPQKGAAKVFAYLHAAAHVFDNTEFTYVRTIVQDKEAMLEFTAVKDGIQLNGVDIIRWNEEGLITDFKVMVRPLKAINLLWQSMAAMLEQQAAG